jgi:hypothetical protein
MIVIALAAEGGNDAICRRNLAVCGHGHVHDDVRMFCVSDFPFWVHVFA